VIWVVRVRDGVVGVQSGVVCVSFASCRSSGRCFVHVGYYVSQVFVDIECITGIVRACGGVNKAVSIE